MSKFILVAASLAVLGYCQAYAGVDFPDEVPDEVTETYEGGAWNLVLGRGFLNEVRNRLPLYSSPKNVHRIDCKFRDGDTMLCSIGFRSSGENRRLEIRVKDYGNGWRIVD